MSTEFDTTTVHIKLTQAYLEMARAILEAEASLGVPDAAEQNREARDKREMTRFAIRSASVIYSYLAVDAFTNWRRYKMWEHSPRHYETIRESEKKCPSMRIMEDHAFVS